MTNAEEKNAPVRQSVHVDCPVEDAFRLFTERFGEWWPWGGNCAMEPWEGGRVFERTESGEEREWGEVTAWEPFERIEFDWRLEGGCETVEVEFRVEADGTRVTVTHSGWESGTQPVMLARCFAEFACAEMLVV